MSEPHASTDDSVKRMVSADRLFQGALRPEEPYEQTVWLRAPQGRFPFRHPGLGR
jgi:hypothetical protein